MKDIDFSFKYDDVSSSVNREVFKTTIYGQKDNSDKYLIILLPYITNFIKDYEPTAANVYTVIKSSFKKEVVVFSISIALFTKDKNQVSQFFQDLQEFIATHENLS